jgi:hypothetical protein
MKKVFILIAFLFTVVCYAAPPPDLPASFLTEDVEFFRSQEIIADYSLEVQEIAFMYRGDNCVYVNVLALANDFLMLSDAEVADGIMMNGNYLFVSKDYFAIKQHSNYSYPFGGNYVC